MRAAKPIACGFVLLGLLAGARANLWAQNVTYDEILHSGSHPEDWLTYGGNYASQRFSELKQVNTENVANLKMQWVYQLRQQGIFESSPIVVDGIMYVTEPPTTVTALDVRTGLPIWRWTAKLPQHLLTIGLFPTNRGVAVLGNAVYVATIDAHLVALDAKTGAKNGPSKSGRMRKRWRSRRHLLRSTGRSSSEWAEAKAGCAASSTPTMPKTASGSGVFTRFQLPANPASKRGRVTAGSMAARRRGIRARTIQN